MAMHARLKNEFTEDEKCHNLMTWLISGLGGWYSYRMSKSALNMVTKNLSIELGRGKKKVICVSLHPGTVDTALSRPYHKNVKNLFSTEESVGRLLEVIDSLQLEDSGKFFTYDKELMPFWAVIMPRTSKKVSGYLCVRPCVRCDIFWSMPYLMNRACFGFEFSFMDSSWKDSWHTFFFVRVISLSGVTPLWKNQNGIWCMPHLMNPAWNFLYGVTWKK